MFYAAKGNIAKLNKITGLSKRVISLIYFNWDSGSGDRERERERKREREKEKERKREREREKESERGQ